MTALTQIPSAERSPAAATTPSYRDTPGLVFGEHGGCFVAGPLDFVYGDVIFPFLFVKVPKCLVRRPGAQNPSTSREILGRLRLGKAVTGALSALLL